MKILIKTTKNNLELVSKELIKDEFKILENQNKNEEELTVDIFDYQLNVALECIKNCQCQDTYQETEECLCHLGKIVYPHAVVHIVNDDKNMSY